MLIIAVIAVVFCEDRLDADNVVDSLTTNYSPARRDDRSTATGSGSGASSTPTLFVVTLLPLLPLLLIL